MNKPEVNPHQEHPMTEQTPERAEELPELRVRKWDTGWAVVHIGLTRQVRDSDAPTLKRAIAAFVHGLAASSRAGGNYEGEKCFICDVRLARGDRVLDDMSGETGHLCCYGKDRDAFVKDLDTGEPLEGG